MVDVGRGQPDRVRVGLDVGCPEVVDDGITGFVVDDLAGAIDAVGRVGAIDRRAVRARVAERFSRDRMVDDYLRVYERILSGARIA